MAIPALRTTGHIRSLGDHWYAWTDGVPDGAERNVEQWADFNTKNHDFPREDVATHMRDEHSTFGWVMERLLTDVGFTLASADYHGPLHGTYRCCKPAAADARVQ